MMLIHPKTNFYKWGLYKNKENMAEDKKRKKFEDVKSIEQKPKNLNTKTEKNIKNGERERPDDQKTDEQQCGRYHRPSCRGIRHQQRLQMPARLEKEPSPAPIKNHTARHQSHTPIQRTELLKESR
jgi:hypothetical protein